MSVRTYDCFAESSALRSLFTVRHAVWGSRFNENVSRCHVTRLFWDIFLPEVERRKFRFHQEEKNVV